MDFKAIAEAAMQLGVIPTVALILILNLHQQNKKLTDMMDKREQQMMQWIGTIMNDVVDLVKERQRERHQP